MFRVCIWGPNTEPQEVFGCIGYIFFIYINIHTYLFNHIYMLYICMYIYINIKSYETWEYSQYPLVIFPIFVQPPRPEVYSVDPQVIWGGSHGNSETNQPSSHLFHGGLVIRESSPKWQVKDL